MKEQKEEQIKGIGELAVQKLKEAEEAKIQREKDKCVSIMRIKHHEKPIDVSWLEEDFYDLHRTIYSLMVPENRNKTVHYAHCGSFERGIEIPKAKLFDYVGLPCFQVEMQRMYTHYSLFCWIEDDLYKILEFNNTHCPSGGCDGESVHQLVGISPEDVFHLIRFTQIYKDDLKRLVAEFDSLPNKKRIIARTKAFKEEMMMVYWHPDRFEKWKFDDD